MPGVRHPLLTAQLTGTHLLEACAASPDFPRSLSECFEALIPSRPAAFERLEGRLHLSRPIIRSQNCTFLLFLLP